MIDTNNNVGAPFRNRRASPARITCITICITLPLLACAALLWLRTISSLPPDRPATFVVKYEEYIAHVLGPVETKQWIEVSSDRCMLGSTMPLKECAMTDTELDALYRVMRDTKFDTINNDWFFREQCFGEGTTLIRVTVNDTMYTKDYPTECTVNERWQTIVGALRHLIAVKQQN